MLDASITKQLETHASSKRLQTKPSEPKYKKRPKEVEEKLLTACDKMLDCCVGSHRLYDMCSVLHVAVQRSIPLICELSMLVTDHPEKFPKPGDEQRLEECIEDVWRDIKHLLQMLQIYKSQGAFSRWRLKKHIKRYVGKCSDTLKEQMFELSMHMIMLQSSELKLCIASREIRDIEDNDAMVSSQWSPRIGSGCALDTDVPASLLRPNANNKILSEYADAPSQVVHRQHATGAQMTSVEITLHGGVPQTSKNTQPFSPGTTPAISSYGASEVDPCAATEALMHTSRSRGSLDEPSAPLKLSV